jgi:hypothetical protein
VFFFFPITYHPSPITFSPYHFIIEPLASVNDEDGAVDEAGGVRAEEDGRLFDVMDAAEAAKRDGAP